LHPEQKGSGNFTVNTELAAGTYQVFVDIKPKNYEYHISSLSLHVGQGEKGYGHNELIPDQTFTKTINGTSVTLKTDQWTVGKPITLDFQIGDQKPEPYLGALGHVVILDEKAQNFIHVHSVSETATKFSTTFEQPGVYKIWGEFKLNGKVNVYPFVVEVK
jgi:hypothetical protein